MLQIDRSTQPDYPGRTLHLRGPMPLSVIALAVALPLGILAAARARSWLDHGSMVSSLLGVSIPNFWLGPMLIALFSLRLNWLPPSGRGGIEHLILPALTLGTSLAAILARMTRASLLEALPRDFVRTARAKGLSEWAVLVRHGLRNALLPSQGNRERDDKISSTNIADNIQFSEVHYSLIRLFRRSRRTFVSGTQAFWAGSFSASLR